MKYSFRVLFLTFCFACLLVSSAFAAQPAEESNGTQVKAPSYSVALFRVPESVAEGAPFIVRLTTDAAVSDAKISWMGKTFHPALSSWNGKQIVLALLGTDVLTAKQGAFDIVLQAKLNGEERSFIRKIRVKGKKYPEQRLKVASKMVTPPESVYAKIKQDRVQVKKALAADSFDRQWSLPLLRPVPGDFSSLYGLRRILNGKPKNPHRGLDFRAPIGTKVLAPAAGKVVLVGDHYYAGKSLYIDHGNGVVSMYFHLSKALVPEGTTVKRGQPVALTGKTGRVTGPHLHWSVSVGGMLVDPMPLLKKSAAELIGE